MLAGLQRAKAQGRRLGRPMARPPIDGLRRVAGLPVHVAAERLGVSQSTVKRWRRRVGLAAHYGVNAGSATRATDIPAGLLEPLGCNDVTDRM